MDLFNNKDISTGLISNDDSDKVEIWFQKKKGKNVTIIQNLDSSLDLKKICSDMKVKFSCSVTIIKDEKIGNIIQMQGNHSDKISKWLCDNNITTESNIVEHGV